MSCFLKSNSFLEWRSIVYLNSSSSFLWFLKTSLSYDLTYFLLSCIFNSFKSCWFYFCKKVLVSSSYLFNYFSLLFSCSEVTLYFRSISANFYFSLSISFSFLSTVSWYGPSISAMSFTRIMSWSRLGIILIWKFSIYCCFCSINNFNYSIWEVKVFMSLLY